MTDSDGKPMQAQQAAQPELAYEHNGQRVAASRFYEIACDPRRSVAVEACAGAGKTWMLVSRIVRALLESDGVGSRACRPHEILAITFTKKAAGEMRERLHEWLEKFAHSNDEVLRKELALRGMSEGQADAAVPRLRALYRNMLEGGRPVQIRTFHSWFAALLRIAPLALLQELDLPASYELLEDDSRAVKLVWRRFFNAVVADESARADYEALVASHGRSQAGAALEAALSKRVEFVLADAGGHVEDAVQTFAMRYPSMATYDAPTDALNGDIARHRWMAWSSALGSESNKTPKTAAAAIVDAFEGIGANDLRARLTALKKAIFIATEDRLKANLAKFEAAQQAEQELASICAAQAQHDAWIHQQRMTRLTRLLVSEFAALKRERGWVDMNDIERAAQTMLSNSALSGWVQERLDAQVKHLLIDEFQDTNPLQWHSIHAWLSGYGGAASDAPKVFLVGDPKQSIYRFRRAEPQVFIAAKAFIAQTLGGDTLSCDHTWRNATRVIGLVNDVMNAAQDSGEFDGFRDHTTQMKMPGVIGKLPQIARDGDAQEPVETAEATNEDSGWRDSLTTPRVLPEEKLSTLECRQAAQWIDGKIASGVKPGEIMVLARRRSKLALMQDELRALHLPTQQPEKNDLAHVAEAQDVLALLDVLVSNSHDLSLARTLRSPIFGATDDDLVWIAQARRKELSRDPDSSRSWFDIVTSHVDSDEALPAVISNAGKKMLAWKSLLQRLPPHDALDAIYESGDLIARYASAAPDAMRESVLANLRALLAASLRVDAARYATPYGFVRAVRSGLVEASAVAAADAVRLLTVHGAKGLEAKIVLMLDTDSGPGKADSMSALIVWPGASAVPTKFVFMVREKSPPACATEAFAEEKAARQREELNALYVAMTRAREELVISSSAPHVKPASSWWRRLEAVCDPIEPGSIDESSAPDAEVRSAYELRVLPNLSAEGAERADGSNKGADIDEPEVSSTEALVGMAAHKLLEWSDAKGAFNDRQIASIRKEFRLDASQASLAVSIAIRILSGEGAWAWDTTIIDWGGNEVALIHEGQSLRMDRLVRRRDTGHWWVLDYKSRWRPDLDAELVDQLTTYRDAVRAAHPDTVVQAAFLGGDGRFHTL